jgi:formate dehydrogenase major subunit
MKIIVDGQEIEARPGQTILEVCKENGVDIPTLCHFPVLEDVGACRLCLVEVVGTNKLQPACTTPITDGMSIRTNTESLNSIKRMTLELIFSEKNHICPFCPMSGKCELQDMGYRFGIESLRYPYLFPSLPVETSNPYFVLDHNRCILCGRCIRACDELVGVHTLDFVNRGGKAFVAADMGIPIGESSCISCGTCVQACPTGALFEKRNAYWCRDRVQASKDTICQFCNVGCGLKIAERDGVILRIDSDWDNPINRGVLCAMGRFQSLEINGHRIKEPLIRKDGELITGSWDEVTELLASRIGEIMNNGRRKMVGIVSPSLPTENLESFGTFVRALGESAEVDVTNGIDLLSIKETAKFLKRTYPQMNMHCTLDDLRDADLYFVVGADPKQTHPVVYSIIRQGIYKRGAKLVIVDPRRTELAQIADLWLRVRRGMDDVLFDSITWNIAQKECEGISAVSIADAVAVTGVSADEIAEAIKTLEDSQKPVVIYGGGVTKDGRGEVLKKLISLTLIPSLRSRASLGKPKAEGVGERSEHGGDNLNMMGLVKGANALGAVDFSSGALYRLDPERIEMLYILSGNEVPEFDEEILDRISSIPFIVLHSYCTTELSPRQKELYELAHVIIPAPWWTERQGKLVNMEGREQHLLTAVLPTPLWLKDELSFIQGLSHQTFLLKRKVPS